MARYQSPRPLIAVIVSTIVFVAGDERRAYSEVISGDSQASGVTAQLTLETDVIVPVLLLDVGVGPTPTASGTAPAGYTDSDTLASLTLGGAGDLDVLGLGVTEIIGLDTGVQNVAADSNVDGTSGSKTTSAQSTVENVDFGVNSVTDLLVVESLVSLDASEVDATAQVSGDYGSLTSTGTTTITGTHGAGNNQALMTVLGVDFLIEANPLANTMFTIDSDDIPLLSGSIDVILNEQILSGDGTSSSGIEVNGIHLIFNNVGVGLGPLMDAGLLNGDVYIASAEAFQETAAVPEPASMFLTGGSLLIFLGFQRRRRRLIENSETVSI